MSDAGDHGGTGVGPLRWIAGLATVVLLALLLVSVLTPPRSAPEGPAPPCPAGFVDRPAIGEAQLRALAATRAGAPLASAAEPLALRFCEGAVERPMISEGRVLLISDAMGGAALTARVGHLLHHAVHGSPYSGVAGADEDCDARVARAVDREAEAYAVEVALRAELGLPPDRFAFEAEARAAEGDARVAVIGRYLRAHPEGGPNLDALGAAYRQRCEIERAEARAPESR